MQEEIEYKALTIKIDEKLHRRLKTLASSKGLKLRELATEIFENELKKEGMR
ncbi:MAG: hypothetical protein KIB00_16815 [Paeniclostridium sordellii]|nr:hypothetical protein [Paeniclostridium sordellii]